MTPPPEEENHVLPSADSVTDPHLASLLRLNEQLDRIREGKPSPSTSTEAERGHDVHGQPKGLC
jgi:hypothetical protein